MNHQQPPAETTLPENDVEDASDVDNFDSLDNLDNFDNFNNGPYDDDPTEATDRMLDVIAAVDFLRRGDRRTLTLWAAIEEALRWWVAERSALLDGVTDPEPHTPRLGDDDPLRGTLTQLIATAGQEEPVHIGAALQQALRRWSTAMGDQYNDQRNWPHPSQRKHYPPPLQLIPTADAPTPNIS